MRFLVDSSIHVGDIAIDVALFHAIVRNGHHLEVVVGSSVADMLVDSSFIARTYARGSSALSKVMTYWKATRPPLDVILIMREWPSKYKPVSVFGRSAHQRTREHMDPNLYARGAIFYRLSMLDGIIDDWRSPIETSIPYKPERYAAACKASRINEGESYLTVAPGASKPEKLWPISNFETVIQHFRYCFSHVVVLGTDAEAKMCEQLAESCNAISLAGKIRLAESCALVSHAKLHLGNDSGLSHVAAGNGVPTVSVGGWQDGHYVPWRQCMLRGSVEDIEPEHVIAIVESMLP